MEIKPPKTACGCPCGWIIVNMVLNVHINHKAYWGWGDGVWRCGEREREII